MSEIRQMTPATTMSAAVGNVRAHILESLDRTRKNAGNALFALGMPGDDDPLSVIVSFMKMAQPIENTQSADVLTGFGLFGGYAFVGIRSFMPDDPSPEPAVGVAMLASIVSRAIPAGWISHFDESIGVCMMLPLDEFEQAVARLQEI